MLMAITLLSGSALTYLNHRRKKNTNNNIKVLNKESHIKSFSTKELLRDFKTSILGDERQQQELILDNNLKGDIEKYHQESNRNLVLYSGAFSIAVLASFYPIFSLLGASAVLYLGRDLFFAVWHDIKNKHFLSVYLLSSILLVGMVLSGHLILAALSGIVGGFFMKIIKKAEDHSEKKLINVFSGHPAKVWIEKDNLEIQVDFNTLEKGDYVIVNAGEIIPVDGTIHTGHASIDQQILTGESALVECSKGDKVFASTLLLSGRVSILTETTGEKTIAAGIGKTLHNTQNYKDNLMARGQKIADSFLPVELGLGVTTLVALGPTPALSIMWSGLGANMALFGPLNVLNYLQILSRQGILIKDGRVFESLRQVDTVIFDKTGTLTLERPTVGKIHTVGNHTESSVLRYAAAAEYRQSHPIAKAIVSKAQELELSLPNMDKAQYEMGYGISVDIEGKLVHVGSQRFMQHKEIDIPEKMHFVQQESESKGYSLIYVAIDQELVGILEMCPTIRPETLNIIRYLKQRGLKLYIISGDHERPTHYMAKQLGIDHYFSEVLPEDKAELVEQLKNEGRFICFIGDGINDAIALKSAQVSISLKGASSIATDIADIVFMDGTLERLEMLFKLSDEFEQSMTGNLVSTVAPGVLNISGVLLFHTGIAFGMGLFYIGALFGLGYTLLPLVKYQNTLAPPEDMK
jgi:Cu2+-exporting ATPase